MLNQRTFIDYCNTQSSEAGNLSFLNIISHLFREAQETMVPLPQSTNFADPSYMLLLQNGHIDSSPAMRLLLAMQKDLLFRAEKWNEEGKNNSI